MFDQDAQRVCVLQGPLSCRFSTVSRQVHSLIDGWADCIILQRTDQPIKELLGEIDDKLVDLTLQSCYKGDVSLVPTVEYLGARTSAPRNPTHVAARHGITHSIENTEEGGRMYTFHLPPPPPPASAGEDLDAAKLPDPSEWIDDLAGPALNWLRAFLASPIYVRRDMYTDNVAQKVLKPRHGQRVTLEVTADGRPKGLKVYGAQRNVVRATA